jgi:hypothetical protein
MPPRAGIPRVSDGGQFFRLSQVDFSFLRVSVVSFGFASPQIEQRAWALKKMPLLADVRKEGEVHEAASC